MWLSYENKASFQKRLLSLKLLEHLTSGASRDRLVLVQVVSQRAPGPRLVVRY